MQHTENSAEAEEDDKDGPAEAEKEEDSEDKGVVAAPEGATLSEPKSSPLSEPCGCSADVDFDWLAVVEGEIDLGFGEALELLE